MHPCFDCLHSLLTYASYATIVPHLSNGAVLQLHGIDTTRRHIRRNEYGNSTFDISDQCNISLEIVGCTKAAHQPLRAHSPFFLIRYFIGFHFRVGEDDRFPKHTRVHFYHVCDRVAALRGWARDCELWNVVAGPVITIGHCVHGHRRMPVNVSC